MPARPPARRPPAPPRLPAEVEPRGLTAEDVVSGARLDELRVVDADVSGVRARGLTLLDVELLRCNLANADARSSSMHRAVVSETRLTGLAWTDGSLQDVVFRGGRIDLASFHSSRLERVTFEDCILREADFQEVRGASVAFHDCDLTGATFHGARFQQCEMRRCTLDDLQGIAGLRGIAMEWGDILALAGAFAAALGIRALDQDEGV